MTPDTTDIDLLTTAQAAALIGWTAQWLRMRRCTDSGPPYVKIGDRTVRYRRDDLMAWIELRRVTPSKPARVTPKAGQ